MDILGASSGSTIAGWHLAATTKGVGEPDVRETILAPQQNYFPNHQHLSSYPLNPFPSFSLIKRMVNWKYEKGARLTPITPRALSGYCSLKLLAISKTFFAVFLGSAGPAKKAPNFSCFSGLSGGYHEISAGAPSKRSGMKTRCWELGEEVARISAPWMVCG